MYSAAPPVVQPQALAKRRGGAGEGEEAVRADAGRLQVVAALLVAEGHYVAETGRHDDLGSIRFIPGDLSYDGGVEFEYGELGGAPGALGHGQDQRAVGPAGQGGEVDPRGRAGRAHGRRRQVKVLGLPGSLMKLDTALDGKRVGALGQGVHAKAHIATRCAELPQLLQRRCPDEYGELDGGHLELGLLGCAAVVQRGRCGEPIITFWNRELRNRSRMGADAVGIFAIHDLQRRALDAPVGGRGFPAALGEIPFQSGQAQLTGRPGQSRLEPVGVVARSVAAGRDNQIQAPGALKRGLDWHRVAGRGLADPVAQIGHASAIRIGEILLAEVVESGFQPQR
jgi:hypothetical protein